MTTRLPNGSIVVGTCVDPAETDGEPRDGDRRVQIETGRVCQSDPLDERDEAEHCDRPPPGGGRGAQSSKRSGMTRHRYDDGSAQPSGSNVAARSGALNVKPNFVCGNVAQDLEEIVRVEADVERHRRCSAPPARPSLRRDPASAR